MYGYERTFKESAVINTLFLDYDGHGFTNLHDEII